MKTFYVKALCNQKYLVKDEIIKVKNGNFLKDRYIFTEKGKKGAQGTSYPKDFFEVLTKEKYPEYFL